MAGISRPPPATYALLRRNFLLDDMAKRLGFEVKNKHFSPEAVFLKTISAKPISKKNPGNYLPRSNHCQLPALITGILIHFFRVQRVFTIGYWKIIILGCTIR